MQKKEIKARINGGNIKLGNMGTFSKLMGDDVYNSKYGDVKGSCGNHCAGCKAACYVRKSYRYPSVIDGHARNTIAIREDIHRAFTDLDGQLSRKRRPFDIVRIHQSGEIETALEMILWVKLAKKHPETVFYTYTKNIDALKAAITYYDNGAAWPENLTVNVSIWHEYGLKDFESLKQYSFIKAFVYDDGYNYKAAGLDIQTYCKAYDKAGKMDHSITCDKCRKCIKSGFKVIASYDH